MLIRRTGVPCRAKGSFATQGNISCICATALTFTSELASLPRHYVEVILRCAGSTLRYAEYIAWRQTLRIRKYTTRGLGPTPSLQLF